MVIFNLIIYSIQIIVHKNSEYDIKEKEYKFTYFYFNKINEYMKCLGKNELYGDSLLFVINNHCFDTAISSTDFKKDITIDSTTNYFCVKICDRNEFLQVGNNTDALLSIKKCVPNC